MSRANPGESGKFGPFTRRVTLGIEVASIANMADPLAAIRASDNSLGSAAGALTGNQPLGKDAFIKLLVAQMKNQDPLKPQTDTQFVAQLAQFSALEQQMSTNKYLEVVASQQQGIANSTDLGLIGRTVSVKGGSINYDGQGFGANIAFSLKGAAQAVTVTVRDEHGNPVRQLELGPKGAGGIRVAWDGKDATGTQQPKGHYTISVEAKGANGEAVQVDQEASGRVNSITFENGRATMVLDNGLTMPTSELLRVTQ